MARKTFPADRLAYRTGGMAGTALTSAAADHVTVYADQACTTTADIQDLTGTAIPGALLVVDDTSQIPRFLGPDGADTLWVMGAEGASVALYPDTQAEIDVVQQAVPNHVAAADPHGDRVWASGQFDAAGAASSAQSAAATDATNKVATHTSAADPHGDRADAAAKYVPLTDARLTNARAPLAHASTHAAGGSDPVTPAAIGALTQAAADGRYLQSSAVGAASGAASLDATGKVPVAEVPGLPASQVTSGTFATAQIPDLSGTYLTAVQKGTASGVASLDAGGKVPVAEVPSLDASQVATGTFTASQIPDLSGTYLTAVQKAAASGVASLDATGKVPTGQIPELPASQINSGTFATAQIPDLSGTYLTATQKGAASGVASLDATGKVPVAQVPGLPASQITSGTFTTAQIPDLSATYLAVSQKGAASGLATLDASSKIPTGQIPNLPASQINSGTFATAQIPDLSATYLAVSQKGAASGVASLDASALVPVAQIPDLSGTYLTAVQKGTASGVASLDATGKVPAAQLPASTNLMLDTTAADIQPLGTQAAGAIGKAADAGHVHAMPRLDQVGAPTAAVNLNSQKITSIANGTAVNDAAAFGQIPTALPPNGAASGDLSGSYPGPTVAKVNGVALSGTPASGNVLSASSGTAAAWGPLTASQIPDLSATYMSLATYGNQHAPSDHGLIAWTMPPSATGANGTSLAAGYIYLLQVVLRQPATISKLEVVIGTAGATLTANQCLAGLYTLSGTRVAVTGDMSTTWNSAGDRVMTLTSSYAAAAGRYYIALLFNGTTSPTFACGSTFGASFTPGNANLTAGNYRWCRIGTGQTTLPTSVTVSSATPDANNIYAAAL